MIKEKIKNGWKSTKEFVYDNRYDIIGLGLGTVIGVALLKRTNKMEIKTIELDSVDVEELPAYDIWAMVSSESIGEDSELYDEIRDVTQKHDVTIKFEEF